MRPVRYRAWWIGGIAGAALAAAAYGLAPDPPRLTLLESAQTQHRILVEIDAATYAPAEYEEYVRSIERARHELSAQGEKYYYSRQYLTFDRLSRESLVASGTAERAARERRASLQLQVASVSRDIDSQIAVIRTRLHRIGLSPANRSRLIRAEVLLREAEILGESNDWYEAGDKINDALSLVQSANSEQQDRAGRLSDAGLLKQWDQRVRRTVDSSLRDNSKAVLVVKSRNRCLLLADGRVIRSYEADLGKNGVFDKTYRGDDATPEGMYRIIKKKGAGHSKYYKALLINYPNEEDIRMFRRARTLGLFLPRTRIGGLIEIHGDGGREQNWTEGCVALINSDMDDLFALVDVGTPVTIVGNASEVDRLAVVNLTSGGVVRVK